jgi:acyl-CoA synthetase (AMP-forming)/AMP-acid ligase II
MAGCAPAPSASWTNTATCRSSGEWISSIDLENPLSGHPAVREPGVAGVAGVADDRWTERPLAFVVPESDLAPQPDDLRAYLVERVARLWVPERWAFVDEIPKTSVGKIDKKLRDAGMAGSGPKKEDV